MLSFRFFTLLLITLTQSTLSSAQTAEVHDEVLAEYICLADMGDSLNIDQVMNEAAEWHLQLGSALFYSPEYDDDVNELGNAAFADPYDEMPLSRLLQYVDEGDHLAMTALLQREDVEIEKQIETANYLVSLGYTGVAISYLINVDLISAEVIYEERGEVTSEVKQHVKDALRYVSFSIQRQDFIALDGYIMHTLSDSFPKELQHTALLTPSDYKDIMQQTEAFIQHVRLRREEMNFTPLSQIDIPDAARHTSDLLLASSYQTTPNYIESLKLIDKDGKHLLRKTECIEKLLTLLST